MTSPKDLTVQIIAKSADLPPAAHVTPPAVTAPAPAATHAPVKIAQDAPKLTPPTPPKLEKRDGETASQAVTRHVAEHDAHLSHLENEYGVHTPRGTASIMMGLPGSGKSHYLNKHHLSQGVHMHVDVDALKSLAPGEKDWKYPSHYPDPHPLAGQPHPLAGQQIQDKHYDEGDPVHVVAAHPVSKRLEQQQFDEATKRRLPVALDTTGGNHKKWGERIDTVRSRGYHHVGLVNIRVSKQTSMARNAKRKRNVPQAIIDETFAEHTPHHPGNDGQTPFQHLSKKVDKVHVVDHEPREVGKITKRAAAGWHNYLTTKNGGAGPDGKPMVKASEDRFLSMVMGTRGLQLRADAPQAPAALVKSEQPSEDRFTQMARGLARVH